MATVKFKFNKEKDLGNHWHKSNWKNEEGNFFIDPTIKKVCEGKSFEECREELKSTIHGLQNLKFIPIYIKSVEDSWKLIEKEFFKRMDKLMKNNYDSDINAYLTTVGICPYDPEEPSFMFSFFYPLSRSLQTCGHEIMHLYFHKFYWDKVEKEIGKEKTWDLKEALTVLLNFEFKDLWFSVDQGYDSHKDLRKFISIQWKENKDFDELLKKCIEHLK